jgi:hypothetical protein
MGTEAMWTHTELEPPNVLPLPTAPPKLRVRSFLNFSLQTGAIGQVTVRQVRIPLLDLLVLLLGLDVGWIMMLLRNRGAPKCGQGFEVGASQRRERKTGGAETGQL